MKIKNQKIKKKKMESIFEMNSIYSKYFFYDLTINPIYD